MNDHRPPHDGKLDKPATIFDVAKAAGVSIKTVSRVINLEANVRQTTRDKVNAAIEALSYLPNAAARVLSGKRFYVIGLIYENPSEFSYMQKVLNGALKACEAGGYTLLLLPLTLPNPDLIADVRRFVSSLDLTALFCLPRLATLRTFNSCLPSCRFLLHGSRPKPRSMRI